MYKLSVAANRQSEGGPILPWRSFLLVMLTAAAIRLLTILILQIEPQSDYAAYYEMARNLVSGAGLKDPFGNYAYYSAGYPLLLAGMFVVTDPSILAAQIVNVILGTFTVALIIHLALEVSRDALIGLVAGLLWALYVPSIIYAEYLAKENLMCPLVVLLALLTLRVVKGSSKWGTAAILGIGYGVLGLTAPVGIAFAPVTALYVLVRKGILYGAGYLIVVTGGAMLVLTPWLVRNHTHFGSIAVSTNGGFNLYLGNNPNAEDAYFMSIGDTPMGDRWHEMRAEMGEYEASRKLGRLGIEYIQSDPISFLRRAGEKLVVFWKPPVHEGQYGNLSMLETVSRFFWLMQYSVLCLLALYVLRRPEIMRQCYLLVGWIGSYWLLHGIFYIIFRYRLPIMPLTTILAAASITALMTSLTPRVLGKLRSHYMSSTLDSSRQTAL